MIIMSLNQIQMDESNVLQYWTVVPIQWRILLYTLANLPERCPHPRYRKAIARSLLSNLQLDVHMKFSLLPSIFYHCRSCTVAWNWKQQMVKECWPPLCLPMHSDISKTAALGSWTISWHSPPASHLVTSIGWSLSQQSGGNLQSNSWGTQLHRCVFWMWVQ